MADQNTIALDKRCELIKRFPCFSTLTPSQSVALANLMHEMTYNAQERVISEHEIVDSIYIIVSGQAEITREVKKKNKLLQVPTAVLGPGEGIGLNDTGFYSATGKRTASVVAISDMVALRLEIKDLYAFLHSNQLESSMHAASLQMLRMRFIKQSLPFAKLSHERLQWLADHVEDERFAAGEIIFQQGEAGSKCYLIRSGAVEILSANETGGERQIALLKPPVLFGEATLITHTPRNATARALEETTLLTLRHEYLSELIETENNVAHVFMSLTVDRSRPNKNTQVTMHQRTTADGETVTILKNPNGSYFKLSQEGAFIWEQLDGKQTLQDITLALAEKFNVFAPDVVAALISKLFKSGFISNIEMIDADDPTQTNFFTNFITKIRYFAEYRKAFGDADPWITRIYNRYIKYFFTKPGQVLLMLLATLGFIAFVANTHHIFSFFNSKQASLWLVLWLIPLSVVEVVLHELGRAFAVKAFGRDVHYIGVGWFWLSPIAFTDTSDMWLATRKPRMLVNLAGIYVDILMAGLCSILILFIHHPSVQSILWLFALYTYIGAVRLMSPLQELDGYYVLMDWLEKTRLRQSAVIWLVRKFPKSIRHPSLLRGHRAEISYWLACLFYIAIISVITLAVQTFVFRVIGIHTSNPYLSLALPIFVAIFSSLGIIADIRKADE